MRGIILLFLLIIFIYPRFTYAQLSIKSATDSPVKNTRNQLQLLNTTGIDKTLDLIVNRLDAAVNRLGQISDRISSRIEKLQISRNEASQLNSQYQTIIDKIHTMQNGVEFIKDKRIDLNTVETGYEDYDIFKNRAVDIINQLDEVLKDEMELVSEIKKYN